MVKERFGVVLVGLCLYSNEQVFLLTLSCWGFNNLKKKFSFFFPRKHHENARNIEVIILIKLLCYSL